MNPIHTPPPYTPHIARILAVRAHGDQKYGDKPYVVHLDEVAALVTSYGADFQVVAFLHDALEDTYLTEGSVVEVFGETIARAVAALTDPKAPNRRLRKAAAYARLCALDVREEHARIALVVKAADRLANVRACVRDGNRGLFEMYRKEHSAFSDAVGRPGHNDAFMSELDVLVEPGRIWADEASTDRGSGC